MSSSLVLRLSQPGIHLSATLVLELVELSSDIGEILVLNFTSCLESFPVQAWVLYPKDS